MKCCIHPRQVSVSQTVEHSSTIISDILSRILNETVMREETICRICFDLLNDIDYHLKVRYFWNEPQSEQRNQPLRQDCH